MSVAVTIGPVYWYRDRTLAVRFYDSDGAQASGEDWDVPEGTPLDAYSSPYTFSGNLDFPDSNELYQYEVRDIGDGDFDSSTTVVFTKGDLGTVVDQVLIPPGSGSSNSGDDMQEDFSSGNVTLSTDSSTLLLACNPDKDPLAISGEVTLVSGGSRGVTIALKGTRVASGTEEIIADDIRAFVTRGAYPLNSGSVSFNIPLSGVWAELNLYATRHASGNLTVSAKATV